MTKEKREVWIKSHTGTCKADYQAAEISAVARVSGDENLISISEDDDRCIHCETAIRAFGIKVPDGENRKKYVKREMNPLRSASKIVLFG